MAAVSTLGKEGQENQNLMTTQLCSEFKVSQGYGGPSLRMYAPKKNSLKPSYISSSVALIIFGVIWMNIHSLKRTTYLLFNLVSWNIYQTSLQWVKKYNLQMWDSTAAAPPQSPTLSWMMTCGLLTSTSCALVWQVCATSFAVGKLESLCLHRNLSNQCAVATQKVHSFLFLVSTGLSQFGML